MSGHSKWSTIKRKKGALDERRGALFAKIAKELTVAARLHGANPSANQRLRKAIGRGKECNMPKIKISQAIAKGAGKSLNGENQDSSEELLFEAFLAKGVALLIFSTTDKRSRTTPEIKSILKKYQGQLVASQTVQRLFQRTIEFFIGWGKNADTPPPPIEDEKMPKRKKEEEGAPDQKASEETLLEVLTNFGDAIMGDWSEVADSSYPQIKTLYRGRQPAQFRDALEAGGFVVREGDDKYVPKRGLEISLSSQDSLWATLTLLLTDLENHPEVDKCFHNAKKTRTP